jgi:hypothetical protein
MTKECFGLARGLPDLLATDSKCPIYCFCCLCNADPLIAVLSRAEYIRHIWSRMAHFCFLQRVSVAEDYCHGRCHTDQGLC